MLALSSFQYISHTSTQKINANNCDLPHNTFTIQGLYFESHVDVPCRQNNLVLKVGPMHRPQGVPQIPCKPPKRAGPTSKLLWRDKLRYLPVWRGCLAVSLFLDVGRGQRYLAATGAMLRGRCSKTGAVALRGAVEHSRYIVEKYCKDSDILIRVLSALQLYISISNSILPPHFHPPLKTPSWAPSSTSPSSPNPLPTLCAPFR
jgi:hypothetical protein